MSLSIDTTEMGAIGGRNFKGTLGGRDTQNCGSHMNIQAQETTQRQDEKHSTGSKDDQLIEGRIWIAQLQEGNEVTEEVGDDIIHKEDQLDQVEGMQQGVGTTD